MPQGKALFSLQKKSVFYKIMRILYPYKNALWALRPAKPLGVLSRHPCRNPKPLPLGERQCMLGWLCIVQSLWAYTPGVRAGAECGATAPSPCWGLRPSTPFLTTIEVFRQSDPPFKKQRIRHIFTYSENTHVLLYRRQAPGGRL